MASLDNWGFDVSSIFFSLSNAVGEYTKEDYFDYRIYRVYFAVLLYFHL